MTFYTAENKKEKFIITDVAEKEREREFIPANNVARQDLSLYIDAYNEQPCHICISMKTRTRDTR